MLLKPFILWRMEYFAIRSFHTGNCGALLPCLSPTLFDGLTLLHPRLVTPPALCGGWGCATKNGGCDHTVCDKELGGLTRRHGV